MARSNLRCATIQLVHRSPRHLSWRFRRRIFPIDVCDTAIGSGRLSEQHRVVRADAFPFWPWNFSADAAHRALSDVWRHIDLRAFSRGSILNAHRAASSVHTKFCPPPQSWAAACGAGFFGARMAEIVITCSARFFNCSKKKAGATRSILVGMSGTSKSMETFGGALFSKL